LDQLDHEDPQVPPDPQDLKVSKECEVNLVILDQLVPQVDPDQEECLECPEKMVTMEMMELQDPQVLLAPRVTVVYLVCLVSLV